ncbi:MAG: putative lipid II flippase FtsW [Candidatus Levyibacteriota bacterium]
MKKIDLLLLATVVFLTLFGLLMIYDASSFIAFRDFADKNHYVKDQALWVVLGFCMLLFFSFFDYRRLYNLSIPLLIVAIIFLSLVFVPGVGIQVLGARRWIDAGVFVIQPAEFIKLSLAVYLSAWFSRKEKGRSFAFFLLLGLVMVLVMLEPDLGTASIIFLEAVIIYFLSGANILYFIGMAPIVAIGLFLLIKVESYRAQRLAAFLNINQSLQNSSYHVKQILIALGMGGLTGVGLGNSLQKYAYLPENTTDSIFAIIAEEIGFIGATILIVLLAVVIWRGFYIALNSKDPFGRLLAGGITSFLAIQMILNLGSQTALFPLTGIPLPFISYGGSSLVVDLLSVGILLNISKNKI